MKIILLSITLLFTTSFSNSYSNIEEENVISTVYVCGKSNIYHNSKSHTALGRCKSGIKSMSVSEAKRMGKRICKCRH